MRETEAQNHARGKLGKGLSSSCLQAMEVQSRALGAWVAPQPVPHTEPPVAEGSGLQLHSRKSSGL